MGLPLEALVVRRPAEDELERWGASKLPSRVRPVLAPEELETERGLCERARGGDRGALGLLLERHGPRLYRAVLLP